MRERTRLPYPLLEQLRFVAVNLAFRVVGFLVKRRFRRQVTLTDLEMARILVLKPCCLGDVVFATAFLRELRRSLPRARIAVAVGQHSAPALAGNTRIDEIVDLGATGQAANGLKTLAAQVRLIKSGNYAVCFVLERSFTQNLIPLLAGIPLRIGIDSDGRGMDLSVGVSPKPARPESELYLDLLRAVGGRPWSGELEYRPSANASDRVATLLAPLSPSRRAVVALHCAGGLNPGMSLPRKRWPSKHFAGLARLVIENGGAIVLIGSPEDREVAENLRQELAASGADTDSILDLTGQLSLNEVAALACAVRAYVGNDSGPSHLVEAAGARVITLYGPSSALRYGPRGANSTAISSRIWCSPCFEDGRYPPCAHVQCMESITVERVWKQVERAMATSVSTQ